MRINKYLAQCGLASRRKCEEYILAGAIRVNGTVVKDLATQIDPDNDNVTYKDTQLHLTQEDKAYYILNKPKGYLCSQGDPQGRETIYDLMEGITERIFHVGRLDYDTEGLLLLTNDGDLANKLLHPRFKVPKKYFVQVDGEIKDREVDFLCNGVHLEEGVTEKAEIQLINRNQKKSIFYMTISQGWKRQIRRMIEEIGLSVTYLKRESFATLNLNDLEKGRWRKLTDSEIQSLFDLT